MIGKLFVIFAAVAAIAFAEPCRRCGGYLSTGFGSGYVSSLNSNIYGNVYPSRVLNAARTVPAVSTYPAGSAIATPAVLSPYDPSMATPFLSTGVIRSGLYGSTAFGRCRTGLLSSY